MFSIGDFAWHGRVSVRMLRHYDAVGLLRPARVDPVTGYRSYEAHQLSRLNRIVALKNLGFTLQQVRSILDDRVSADEPRGMLRLRHVELQSQISADEDCPDGDGVLVHAGLPVSAESSSEYDFSVVDLPEIEQAATIVHRGSMDEVMPSVQTLARWIDANGYRSAGYSRELYIECTGDRDTWVTELQEPVLKS